MKLAIDASNVSLGGGVTHLVELLRAAEPEAHGFERIVMWAPRVTLAQLPERPWLELRHDPALERSIFSKLRWQRSLAPRLESMGIDVLFLPGSLYAGSFQPYVAMSQNLLPFMAEERSRYGLTATRLRYHLLELGQTRTFRRAAGVLFLSDHARERVTGRTGPLPGRVAVVPHGIPERFFRDVPEQKPVDAYGTGRPFRWLYVSPVIPYKHPWTVAEAAVRLSRRGLPVRLGLVGGTRGPAALGRGRLEKTLERIDPAGRVVVWEGPVKYRNLHRRYARADGFVFASTCENLPITLLEAMASGLPIACSDRPPMPQVLGRDGGVFMDPESVDSVEAAMLELTRSAETRARVARCSRERAGSYSWERCARDTFAFLAEVAGRGGGP